MPFVNPLDESDTLIIKTKKEPRIQPKQEDNIPIEEIKIAVGQWLKIRKRANNKEYSSEKLVWDKLNQWLKR